MILECPKSHLDLIIPLRVNSKSRDVLFFVKKLDFELTLSIKLNLCKNQI